MRSRYVVGLATLILVPIAMVSGFVWGLGWGWVMFGPDDEDLPTSTTETPAT